MTTTETETELAKAEAEYETLCETIAQAKNLPDYYVDGCGLEGDWDEMTDEEKLDALNAAITECEDILLETHAQIPREMR